MKTRFVLGFLLSLWVCPICLPAQTLATGHVPDDLTATQREEALFVYGFYTAYMNGVMYTFDMHDYLLKGYATPAFYRKMRSHDWDLLLDAQDCVEEARNTLYVRPMEGVRGDELWYNVTYRWPSYTPDKLDTRTEIFVRLVKDKKRRYRIADVYHPKHNL